MYVRFSFYLSNRLLYQLFEELNEKEGDGNSKNSILKKLIERECVECGVEDVIVNSRLVDVFEINILRTTKAFRQAYKSERREGDKKILSYGLACNFLKFNTNPVFNSLEKCVLWPWSVTLRRHCVMRSVTWLLTNINNSLHLARKYAQIFVRGRYLFREANSFPRAKLEENCELPRTISEHIFKVKWRLLCLLSFKYFSQHARSASLSYVNHVNHVQNFHVFQFRFSFSRKHMLQEKVHHFKGKI